MAIIIIVYSFWNTIYCKNCQAHSDRTREKTSRRILEKLWWSSVFQQHRKRLGAAFSSTGASNGECDVFIIN